MNGRRIWTLAIGVTMAAAITLVMRPTAAGKKKAPDVIQIKGCAKKKKPVKFEHAKHVKKYKIKCVACHHKNSKDKKEKKCSTCHSKPQKGIDTCFKSSKKKNPFHKNCIGCHKKDKKGPTKCKGCHQK